MLSDEQKRAEYDSFGSQQSTSSGFNQQNPFSQQGRQGNFRWEYKVTTSSIFTKLEGSTEVLVPAWVPIYSSNILQST